MKNSNIDVDIIDETLLYICIDGKREHISVDNARIKYAKSKEVLDLIDLTLERYAENSKPLEAPSEPDEVEIDVSPEPEVEEKQMPSNDEPLPEPKDEPIIPEETKSDSLKDLNDRPLEVVDESKFATIYNKYSKEIGKTFKKEAPSFLDLERIAEKDKPLELVK